MSLDHPGTPEPFPRRQRLALASLLVYSIPAVPVGFMYYLAVLFILKFSTDVLLIAPATVSLILGASRVLDAVTDPLVGYYSDRTRSRLGRRRPWLLGSAVPIALVCLMMWSPPETVQGPWLVAWMGTGIIGFYALMTLIMVPHQSWGAELTPDYHERTRVFGMRLLMTNAGAFAAVAALQIIIHSEDARATVFWMVLVMAVCLAGSVSWCALRLAERADFQGRGPHNPLAAYRDVAANPHARLLLVVFFIESLGSATIGVLTPYMAQYVIVDVDFPIVVLFYMVSMTLAAPLWAPLSRRFGKKNLWLLAMLGTALGFGSFFLLGQGDVWQTYALAAFLGATASCGQVVAPSVQSDIIDYDEHRTGERKEGGYFAAYSFIQKSAAGITTILTGVVLEIAGYVPNVTQTEDTQLAIRILYALFPLVCYIAGSLLFLRFALNEPEHRRIRDALDRRR